MLDRVAVFCWAGEMRTIVCAVALSIAGCSKEKAPEAPQISEVESQPPLLEGFEVGRYVIVSCTYDDNKGIKAAAVLRLDTVTGRSWFLAEREMASGPADASGKIPLLTIEGHLALTPAWQEVMEEDELMAAAKPKLNVNDKIRAYVDKMNAKK